MSLHQTVITYFQGEKLEALVFIVPLGLISTLFGAWLLTDHQEAFGRGAAWPFVVLGLVLTLVGATVGFRTPDQVERLASSWQAEPQAAVSAEIARMDKVNAAWPVYLVGYVAFAVVGLALRFALKQEFAHGLGTALVFFAGLGLLIDGFAERRAQTYTAFLHERAQAVSSSSPVQ